MEFAAYKEFTLIFLFSSDTKEVLLQRKNRGQYPGKINAVGGKVEFGESPLNGAIREVQEETGANISDCIHFYASLHYYTGVQLHVYFAIVDKQTVHQIEDEPLFWSPVCDILTDSMDMDFAGNGDTLFFIRAISDLLT